MNEAKQCSKRLWRSGVWSRTFPCKRAGKVERDGQWYCTQHDPVRVEEREQKSRERWSQRAAKLRLEAAAPMLLDALKRFGCQDVGSCGSGPDGLCFVCAAIARAEGK